MKDGRRTMPEIRARLVEISHTIKLLSDEVVVLAEETRRVRRAKPAPRTARPVTPELRKQVRWYAARNPGKSQREIGAMFEIDGGRVSEILYGKR